MGASETPPFWWQKPDWRAFALAPAAMVYARANRIRLARAPRETVDLPVLRIGDFAVSVPGKTQAAMALARAARKLGHKPGVLCPGPSGFGSAPHLVDRHHDSARHVGDAAVEIAAVVPVAVGNDWAAAARMLAAEGRDFLVMVDGNSAWPLRVHFTLLVVDAGRGLGNERIVPAGPLRGRLTDQVRGADAILRIGEASGANAAIRAAARAARPVHEARMMVRNPRAIAGKKLLALATIKDPGGFFETVEDAGGEIVARHPFAEGHYLSAEELADLLADAEALDARLVTTRRDMIRLESGDAMPEGFRERLEILDIAVEFEVDATAPTIIDDTIAEWRRVRATG
jgi:tetraacyldisaccharide 4'-kinase